jgi:putative PEP-CTERM system TPR-repeat lipoprotein
MLLVLAHLRAGDFNQAIEQVLGMLRDHETDPALQTLAGNVFAASGDHDEARRYLQRALQLKPDLPPALLSLANIEELEKNYPAATRIYRQLVDMDLASALPMVALARVAEKQGDNEAMLGWLQRAVDYAPDDNQPRLLLAEYYLRKGSVEQARPLVKAVLGKSSREPAVLVIQGRLLMAERKYDEALNPLHEFLSHEPDSVAARTLLGECYLELGRQSEAREQLEAALDNDPASMRTMSLLARLEIQGGSSVRALELSKQIQAAYPEFYLGYELAGDALLARGDYQGAGREYALARERLQQVELVIKQAENATLAGNNAAAAGYLQDWLSEHPDDIQAMQFLGTTWQNMGMTELAVEQYERVLEQEQENPVALNNLAGLYQQAGRPEAQALAQRALEAAPNNPGVMDTYAWILVLQGDASEGLRLLEQALSQLPDNPEVRYHHAVAVLQSGDRERGRRLLEALVSEGKPFVGREDAMQMLETAGG